jgi:hypothetical protein
MIDVAPLVGLRVHLKRTIDVPCAECGDSVVTISADPHLPTLHCACCGRHRGLLPKALADFLLEMVRLFGPLPKGVNVRTPELAEANAAAPGAIAAPHHPHPDPETEGKRNDLRN